MPSARGRRRSEMTDFNTWPSWIGSAFWWCGGKDRDVRLMVSVASRVWRVERPGGRSRPPGARSRSSRSRASRDQDDVGILAQGPSAGRGGRRGCRRRFALVDERLLVAMEELDGSSIVMMCSVAGGVDVVRSSPPGSSTCPSRSSPDAEDEPRPLSLIFSITVGSIARDALDAPPECTEDQAHPRRAAGRRCSGSGRCPGTGRRLSEPNSS